MSLNYRSDREGERQRERGGKTEQNERGNDENINDIKDDWDWREIANRSKQRISYI